MYESGPSSSKRTKHDNTEGSENTPKPIVEPNKENLQTNYLSIKIVNENRFYRYVVTVGPEIDENLLSSIFEEFKNENFPNVATLFYDTKCLLTLQKLETDVSVKNFNSNIVNRPVTVKTEFTEHFNLHRFMKYVDSSNIINNEKACRLLTAILRGYPLIHHISIGGNFYINVGRTNENNVLEGLHQTPVLTQRGIMLNVDVHCKRNPVSLLSLICELCRLENTPTKLSCTEINRILRKIQGKKVLYKVNDTSIQYRVNDFKKSAIEEIIPDEQQSVQQYYLQKKNYRIGYPELPLLWVGSRSRSNPILIPIELCHIYQNYPGSKRPPKCRKNAIMRLVRTIGNYENSPYLKEFGVQVGKELEDVQARVFLPPRLKYENGTATTDNGQWKMTYLKFTESNKIKKWAIICLDKNYKLIDYLQDQIMDVAAKYGITMPNPLRENLEDNIDQGGLEQIFRNITACNIFIVLFSDRTHYAMIKRAAEITVGCLTQCVLTGTVRDERKIKLIVHNLLPKINAKCNGVNHTIEEWPAFLGGNVMFMGADVTHPPPRRQDLPSFAAVTASIDENYFKYNMVAQIQPPNKEYIENLDVITKTQLEVYKDKRGKSPDHIIFYRDGVPESCFDQIINVEVEALKKACKEFLKADTMKITFIVVVKRHHARLFSKDYSNVRVGTCVDTDITHPVGFSYKDFYLASHNVKQGVTIPIKYCTIYDDANLTSDNVIQLSYYLCHMNARCNKTVSCPAPTHYAHLAAKRARTLWIPKTINWDSQNPEDFKIQIKNENMSMHFV